MKRPPKCCKPDCFNCPYTDCRYEGIDTDDYTETNRRDYELYEDSTGRKYHKGTDKDYRIARQMAYDREHRKQRDKKEYLKEYYQKHKEEIKERMKQNYDTSKNTKRCKKWRQKNKEKKKQYDKERYLRRKEENEQRKLQENLCNEKRA